MDISTPFPSEKAAPWSDAWWNDFLTQSDFFKNSLVIPDILSEDDVVTLNRLTLNILKEIFIREDISYDFRLYLEGVARDKAFMREHLFQYVPSEEESPAQWATRVFKEQKFGLIINSSEKLSTEMSDQLALYLKPLLKIAGIPLKGVSITIFMGNYGYTPLGIHKDHPGENVMHLHLGPGDKTMYNWEMAEYEELTGNIQNNKDIIPLLPLATAYHFKQGDIYFMPWNKYHIGCTEEFSVGISIWYNNMPLNLFLATLLRSLKNQYTIPESEEKGLPIVPPYQKVEVGEEFDLVLDALKLDKAELDKSFEKVVKDLYQDYTLGLYSNQGWKTRPIPLDRQLDPKLMEEVNDIYHLKGKTISTVSPFKISYKVSPGRPLLIYARGTKIEIMYHPELVKVLDRLNTGAKVLTDDLLRELNKIWPEEAGLYALNLLHNKKAITYSN
jgi:hypothetical protein